VVSDRTLSDLLSVCLRETVLADWLVYYIQAVSFVKVFVGPISKLVFRNFFLSDNSLVFHPVFWGESELYAFALFCQGLFRNSFVSFQSHSFFVLAVLDSEA
jgi:hypothetical protein